MTNTIPNSYNINENPIGDSNIKHPIYSFRMAISNPATESIGPNTNSRTVTMLPPDQFQTSPDAGRTARTNRKNQFLALIPGLMAGENLFHKDEDTFTVYGARGAYIKQNFADIANPLVVVTNSDPYTSA